MNFQIFAPLERVDPAERRVTAYAFVNETVEGEGGLRLRRSAMEAATPDYMRWANVRRMHQPDAVGVAEQVEWDGAGARMSLRVVDDDAWEKIVAGVYKGLSVGVVPTVVQGKDVLACRWVETSLVDRPRDPDARIVAVRAAIPDAQTLEAWANELARLRALSARPERPHRYAAVERFVEAREPDRVPAATDEERWQRALQAAKAKRPSGA